MDPLWGRIPKTRPHVPFSFYPHQLKHNSRGLHLLWPIFTPFQVLSCALHGEIRHVLHPSSPLPFLSERMHVLVPRPIHGLCAFQSMFSQASMDGLFVSFGLFTHACASLR